MVVREVLGKQRGSALPIDAIIVPTINSADRLSDAVDLALNAGSELVVLCSRDQLADKTRIDRRRVLKLLGTLSAHPRTTVVDIPQFFTNEYLRFRTDRHGEAIEGRINDVGQKRNLAVLAGLMTGWRHLFFLDDDVLPNGQNLLHKAGQVFAADNSVESVGWACGEKEDDVKNCRSDNSMACHAARMSGMEQDTFIGGGVLAVRLSEETPLFPTVYNEDWLFLFPLIAREAVVFAGTLTQGEYNPFKPDDIGYKQEFGDVLAEGLFRLFHENGEVKDAERSDYWARVVGLRSKFLAKIAERLRETSIPETQTKVFDVLDRAQRRLTPEWADPLAKWVVDWGRDLDDWATTLRGVPRLGNLTAALTRLGLGSFTAVVPASDHVPEPGEWRSPPRTADRQLVAVP